MEKLFTWGLIVFLLASIALNMYGDYDWTYLISSILMSIWAGYQYLTSKRKSMLFISTISAVYFFMMTALLISGWS